MTVFDDRFTKHAVFGTLDNLRDLLDQAEEFLSTPELVEAHARLIDVAEYIERVLNTAEPSLTPLSILNNINNNVQQAANSVQQFLQNKQPGPLNQANSHIDNALTQARLIYVPLVGEDVESVKERVVSFRKSASQHLRYLQDDFTKARQELKQQVQQVQQSIQQTGQQIQTKLTEIEKEKEGLSQAVRQHQAQFSEAQERRNKDFSEAKDQRSKELQELITSSQKALDEEMDKLVESTQPYLDHLKEIEEEAVAVAGAIGSAALTAGFKKSADSEAKAVFWLQVSGIAATVIALVVAYFAIEPLHSTTQWTRLGGKAILVLPLLGLAGYFFKESSKRRRVSWRNRRLATELASIGPYLERYPDEQSNEIKKVLIERWFAQPEPVDAKEENASPSMFLQVINRLIDLVPKQ